MAGSTRVHLTKTNRSEEHFRKIWISLFDIKILSSCNEKDFDLFCASALLKTTFYHFISIRKRLCDAEKSLETQELELKALKLENEKYNSEFKCEKCASCVHCQKADDNISSERESKTVGAEKAVLQKNVSQGHSETTRAEVRDAKEAGEIVDRIPPVVLDVKLQEKNSIIDSANSVLKEQNSRDVGVVRKEEKETVKSEAGCEVHSSSEPGASTQLAITPKKRPANFLETETNKSPVLKLSKRPKSSSGNRCQRQIAKVTKSPSLLPSEAAFGDPDVACSVSASGAFLVRRNNKLSLGLKRKLLDSPPKFVVSEVDSPESEVFPKANNNSPEKGSRSAEEEEIIMPSPSNSKTANQEAFTKPVEVKKDRRRKSSPRYPDTDVTYFFPKEESPDGHGCSEEDVDHEDGEAEEVVDYEDGAEEPMDGGGGNEAPVFNCGDNSFDRIPPVEDLPFKYRRDVVRKKAERMKLQGWDCRECQKYYEAAGHGSDHAEKRIHLNMCSRHRDNFSPQNNTPKGFWDPVFPETPK